MRENPNDYTPLHLKCYHCHGRGHIAIQCEYFDEIKGNLNKKFMSNREQKLNQDTEKQKELHNSLKNYLKERMLMDNDQKIGSKKSKKATQDDNGNESENSSIIRDDELSIRTDQWMDSSDIEHAEGEQEDDDDQTEEEIKKPKKDDSDSDDNNDD